MKQLKKMLAFALLVAMMTSMAAFAFAEEGDSAPAASDHKVEQPKKEEPKHEEPKAEEPKKEEPKHEEPKAEEPKKEEPQHEEPKADPTASPEASLAPAADPTAPPDPTAEPTAEPTVAPETETFDDEQVPLSSGAPVFNGRVEIKADNKNPAFGDTVRLTSILTGFGDRALEFQWQIDKKDGNGWVDIKDATQDKLKFVYTEEMVNYSWRLMVTIED